ncbi:MAG: dNTP triphosphohydrolase [Calditrichia bacterium]
MKQSKNRFYNDFDYETMETGSALDYRSAFQRDRDRIIHSSAFRRLQAKTQVFLSGEYDFYRTRLTHSIEVAQIGRSICNFLRHHSPLLADDFYIDADLVEAVCLTHDLGHAPFGHAGESTLNRLMRDYGGFEGNAQTLRILTEILYSDGGKRKGMNPTRALMDGVLKYKTLFSELENPHNHFLYNEQKTYLDFVLAGREFPQELAPGKKRNSFRSVECQIMDWADDTAYSLNDVVDGINAGFISREKLEGWAGKQELNAFESDHLENLLKVIKDDIVERTFARRIGKFIRSCELQEDSNFMSDLTNRYRFGLKVDPTVEAEASFYKRLSTDLVFRSPQLHQLEYKWDFILEKIFEVLKVKDPNDRARMICDQLSGMTDGFAIRTYKRLFDPDFGSIVDLV